jgi:mannose-1-phosphate guanylyltransferase
MKNNKKGVINMTNIILCGGSGTRLWPLSRKLLPKQFLKLFNNSSLFQLTLKRNRAFCQNQIIVSNKEQFFLASEQIDEAGEFNINYILEPVGKNTAPAIAISAFALDKDEIMLVTPSDHLIKDLDEYSKVIDKALSLAKNNYLVTFGITPLYPESGYGYIEANGEDVIKFHEKPDIKTAEKYLQTNNQYANNKSTNRYYWNSGMFMFKAGIFLEELQKYSPTIYKKAKKAYINRVKTSNNIGSIKLEDMQDIPEDSIDYAVMEKSNRVKVVASNIDWSDVGSFDALFEELPKDENNNTKNSKHISIDSKNNLIYAKDKYIATVDIEDLIIVDTGDALLVSKKGSSQKVKEVVKEIKKNTDLHNVHLTGYRPWGTYTVLEETEGYKIKRIVVKPGKRLSLQKHFHRNEHWIVVSGTATVTVGDEVKLVRPNESTYIKMGETHRLENEGKIPVVLIEAQVGEYTGEDDIVRIDDDYKRT